MNSILTVTTAAATQDLTSLANVKLEFDITDNSKNTRISEWIRQASAIAATYCKRAFARETVTETFWPDGGSISVPALILRRYPVASVSSITVDDELVAASEYRINAANGMVYRLDTSGYQSTWSASKSIVVVYAAGYTLLAELPFDIERAVIMMIKDFRSDAARDPNLKSKTTEGVSSYEWWIPGDAKTVLPIEIAGLLDPYVNHRVW